MARTTPDLVRGVLLRDYDGAADLTPFIATAGVLADGVRAKAEAANVVVTDALLELIERWLGAHFYRQSDRGFASRSEQGAGGTYDGKTGAGLESTFYGQSAKRLDPTGFLVALDGGGGVGGVGGGRAVASGFWAGTEDW